MNVSSSQDHTAEPTVVSRLENLPSELLFQTLLTLPISDLLNVCQVSTRLRMMCNNWSFWGERAYRDFEFPRPLFLETQLDNPRRRYQEIQDYNRDPKTVIPEAALTGNQELLKYLLSRGITNINAAIDSALYQAACGGHLDLVEYLLDVLGSSLLSENVYINSVLAGAAAGGYLNIVNVALQHGAQDLTRAMASAAYHGRLNVIDYLIDHGAHNLNIPLWWSASGGYLDVVREMIARGANDLNTLNEALKWAASGNQLTVVKYLIRRGANDINGAFLSASANSSINVMEYLIGLGADNFDEALQDAAKAHQVKSIEYILDYVTQNKITVDLNAALLAAAEYGSVDITRDLINHGASNIREAYEEANHRYPELIQYFQGLLSR